MGLGLWAKFWKGFHEICKPHEYHYIKGHKYFNYYNSLSSVVTRPALLDILCDTKLGQHGREAIILLNPCTSLEYAGDPIVTKPYDVLLSFSLAVLDMTWSVWMWRFVGIKRRLGSWIELTDLKPCVSRKEYIYNEGLTIMIQSKYKCSDC